MNRAIRFIRSTIREERAAALDGFWGAVLTFGVAVYAFAMVTGQ